MLFQPTNITPSSFAGVGGDLVLAGHDMVVTWQVNGTSPMTAYQIVIYANNASSTQLYTTGKVTLNTPFYGVDGMGNVVPFSATIDSADLSSAGVVSGSTTGYKYKITQWWDTNDYIEQSSENWFIIQTEPSVTIDTTTLTSPSAPITGSYAQSEGVGLDWVRWVIELADPGTNLSTGTVLLDSGKIHTQILRYSYDGWVSGTKYAVTLTYQLQNGYTGETSAIVSASWAQMESRANVTAALTRDCANAVIWYPVPTFSEISGTPSGVSVVGKNLIFSSGSETLEWDGGIMTGNPAYGFLVWCGIPYGTITMETEGSFNTTTDVFYRDNTLRIELDPTAGTLTWTAIGDDENETGTFSIGSDISGQLVTVIAGVGTWYVVVQTSSTRMTVNGTQSSAQILARTVFSINGNTVSDNNNIEINGTVYNLQTFDGENQNVTVYDFVSPIKSSVTIYPDNAVARLSGLQECRFIGIVSSQYTEETMNELLEGTGEQPVFTPDWLFLSNWENDGYDVFGVLKENTTEDTPQTNSIIVYRRENGAPYMEKLFAISGQENMESGDIGKIIDYAVVSGKNYTYSVYYAYEDGNGGTSFSMMVRTGSVSPCYWDWILTTAERNEDGTYHVTGSYRFGLNLETGAMSNNNAPTLMTNFTRYPTRQGVSANYRSGSLTSFIGSVDAAENTYIDTAEQADAILALGASTDTKFLRSRKGELWMVDTAAATMVQVGDKYKEQPYTATLSWVETGSASNVPIISIPTDAAWEDAEGTPGSSGTSDIITTPLLVTENGVYTAPNGFAYTPVTVMIPTATGVSF